MASLKQIAIEYKSQYLQKLIQKLLSEASAAVKQAASSNKDNITVEYMIPVEYLLTINKKKEFWNIVNGQVIPKLKESEYGFSTDDLSISPSSVSEIGNDDIKVSITLRWQ